MWQVLSLWSCALLERLKVVQLFDIFPVFYETQRFITVVRRAVNSSLNVRDRISHPYGENRQNYKKKLKVEPFP
jgi:hypothetical protein